MARAGDHIARGLALKSGAGLQSSSWLAGDSSAVASATRLADPEEKPASNVEDLSILTCFPPESCLLFDLSSPVALPALENS